MFQIRDLGDPSAKVMSLDQRSVTDQPPPLGGTTRRLRTDIQGLRAIAVAMVVIYHLEHRLLPGGYVGVDVFFVISGFLITSHLVRKPPRRSGDFAEFWARRVRRLLPASLLVLLATLALVRLFAPETQWASTARDVRAATFYVVNWSLAADAVDYLALDNLPTAVQHFWSLSVEEQFYFFWPVLVAGVAAWARWMNRPTRLPLACVLSAVVAASLVFSVWYTAKNPSAAYFVTPTRIWELGLGALIAVALIHGARAPGIGTATVAARNLGSWLGLGMIAIAGLTYSSSTPFPSYQAALPVLGTALVVMCQPEPEHRGGPGRFLATWPMQRLGDISYSVYLWHWPLIVLATWLPVPQSKAPQTLVILLLTLVLGALTERWVERPFRAPRVEAFRKATYILAAGAMVIVAGGAGLQLREVTVRASASRLDLASADTGDQCFGAGALDPEVDCPPVPVADVVPAPSIAASDRSEAYEDVGGTNCWSHGPSYPSTTCTFGASDAEVSIVLFGNSHAGHWLPALQRLADEHHWRIDTYLANQCASADVAQTFATAAATQGCREWVRRSVDAIVESQPSLVVMSNRVSVPAEGFELSESLPSYAVGYEGVLHDLEAAGLSVAVIRDTPAPGAANPRVLPPTCVAERGDSYAECQGTRDQWVPDDPVEAAIETLGSQTLRVVDMTDHICEPEICHAVNGGVLTYFDGNHMTATFAATLAPYLYPYLQPFLLDG